MITNQNAKFKVSNERNLIPKTFSEKFKKSNRYYFHFSQESIVLPIFFNYLSTFIFLLSLTIPSILPLNKDMWEPNSQFTILAKFMSFFWKYGAIWTDYKSIIISVSILIIVFFLVSIPNTIIAFVYFSQGRISKIWRIYTTVSFEIIIPILLAWFPSELGAMVHLLYTDLTSLQAVTISILLCVVLIFLIILISFTHSFLFPRLNYQNSRSNFWVDSDQTFFYLIMIFQLFFTEMIELIDSDKTIRTIAIVLETVIHILLLLKLYTANIVINQLFRVSLISLSTSSFIIYIMNIFQIYGLKFDLNIAVFLFLIVFLIVLVVSYALIKQCEKKSMKIYDELEEGFTTFELQFKSDTQFLNHSRNAFMNGHPYLFRWESFKWAIEKFPNSTSVWMQAMRFMAIYYEHLNDFIKLYEKYHKQQPNSIMINTFLFYCRRCINRRNKQSSKDISLRFKEIDDKIKDINESMISYWTAVENNAPSLAFRFGSYLSDDFKSIEANFNQLIGFYPNNPKIFRKYSNFLNDYANDLRRSQTYLVLALRLSNRDRHVFDSTAQSAFGMFPLIPRVIQELQSNTDTLPLQTSESTSTSLSNTISSLIRSNDSTSTTIMTEIEDSNSSQVREKGSSILIPSVRNFIVWFVIFFIIIYVIGLFTSPFLILVYSNKFDTKFDIVTKACNIIYLLNKIPNILLTEAMIISGTYPTIEDEQYILTNSRQPHSDYIANPKQIATNSIELNNLIHQFSRLIEDSLSPSSKLSEFWINTQIEFTSHHGMQNLTYYNSLSEALTSVCADFFKYNSDYSTNSVEFINQSWFIDSVLNSRTVSLVLIEFTQLCCEDASDILNDLQVIIILFNIVYGGLLLISVPILLIQLKKLNAGWEYIMDSIRSLPLISIRNVIDHITHLSTIQHKNENEQNEQQEEQNDPKEEKTEQQKEQNEQEQHQQQRLISPNSSFGIQDENLCCNILKKPNFDKYTNLFIHLATSNDNTFNTIIRQGVLMACDFIIALLSIFLLSYFTITESKKLKVLPYRLTSSAKLNGITSLCITDILRRMTLDNQKQLSDDNRISLFTDLKNISEIYQTNLDEFLFGSYDHQKSGVVSTSQSLIDDLLTVDNQWLNQTLMHDRLVLMPPLLMIIVLNQQFTHLVERSTRINDYFTSTDFDILLFVHTINSHLDAPIFKNQIDTSYISLAQSTIQSLVVIIFVISCGMLFIGLILLILIMSNTIKIKITSQFCLANLSMIDYEYLERNQRILQILSGQFSKDDRTNNSAINVSSFELADEARDCIIILEMSNLSSLLSTKHNNDNLSLIDLNEDDSYVIKFVNQKTKDFFRFDEQMCLDMPFFNIFQFTDYIPFDSDEVTSIETTVSVINSDASHEMKVTIVHPKDKENSNKIVILMKSHQTDEKKSEMIKDMEEQIRLLKSKVMPPEIYKKANGAFQLKLHNIIFVVVDMSFDFDKIVCKAKENNAIMKSTVSFDTEKKNAPAYRRSSTPHIQISTQMSTSLLDSSIPPSIKTNNNTSTVDLNAKSKKTQFLGINPLQQPTQTMTTSQSSYNFGNLGINDQNPTIGGVPSSRSSKRLRFLQDIQPDSSDPRLSMSGSASSAIFLDGTGYTLTAEELSDRFKAFFDVIDNEIHNSVDVISIKHVGVACFLAFNLVNESNDVNEVISDALEFCHRVSQQYHKKKIAFQIGMAYDSSAVAGMVSEDRLLFDVYSNGMQIAYSLARKCDESSLAISDSTLKFTNEVDLSSSKHERMLIGNIETLYHEIKL